MKNLILLFGLLFGSLVFAQDITFKNGLYFQNDVAYTGKHTVYYASGVIKEEFLVKEGKLDGEIVKYYDNGSKMEVGNYENNLKFGLWTRFNTSGSVIAEASYKNGKKDGSWVVYDDKGTKLFKMEYKDGEKVGTWNQWDENGNLIKSTDYASM
jgi:antitoxin component YwqK of YwqJK toxin-antitoxin module